MDDLVQFVHSDLGIVLILGILMASILYAAIKLLIRIQNSKTYRCVSCHVMMKHSVCCIVEESVSTQKSGKRYCQNCVRKVIADVFQAFTKPAVMIYPNKKNNAYQFYTLTEYPNYGADESCIEALHNALPSGDQRCDSCQVKANYAWYANDISDTDGGYEDNPTYLCGHCLTKAFIAKLDNEAISLSNFIPPHDSEGLGKPWEY